MDGKDAIISNILASADSAAKSILGEAEAEYNEIINSVKSDLENKRVAKIEKAEAESKNIVARRITLANLDARKTVLAAKQRVIAQTYYQVGSKLLNMTDHIYRDFIGGIVEKFAEDWDTIMIAERDAKRLHDEWVISLAKKLNIHLSLSQNFHSGRGGIILVGKKYDKNFTFDSMLEQLRAETEASVAKKLFRTEN